MPGEMERNARVGGGGPNKDESLWEIVRVWIVPVVIVVIGYFVYDNFIKSDGKSTRQAAPVTQTTQAPSSTTPTEVTTTETPADDSSSDDLSADDLQTIRNYCDERYGSLFELDSYNQCVEETTADARSGLFP